MLALHALLPAFSLPRNGLPLVWWKEKRCVKAFDSPLIHLSTIIFFDDWTPFLSLLMQQGGLVPWQIIERWHSRRHQILRGSYIASFSEPAKFHHYLQYLDNMVAMMLYATSDHYSLRASFDTVLFELPLCLLSATFRSHQLVQSWHHFSFLYVTRFCCFFSHEHCSRMCNHEALTMSLTWTPRHRYKPPGCSEAARNCRTSTSP
jgi:hypothetical protein